MSLTLSQLQRQRDILLNDKEAGRWSSDLERILARINRRISRKMDNSTHNEYDIHLVVDGGVIEGEGVYWSVGECESDNTCKLLATRSRDRTQTDSTAAEYLAIIDALKIILLDDRFIGKCVTIHSDSLTAIKQITRKQKTDVPHLISLMDKVIHFKKQTHDKGIPVDLKWTPRIYIKEHLGH